MSRFVSDFFTVDDAKGTRFLATREIHGPGRPTFKVWVSGQAREATRSEIAFVRAAVKRQQPVWKRQADRLSR